MARERERESISCDSFWKEIFSILLNGYFSLPLYIYLERLKIFVFVFRFRGEDREGC